MLKSYTERSQVRGEHIRIRGHLHWVIFLTPLVWTIATFIFADIFAEPAEGLAALTGILAGMTWVNAIIRRLTTEFAVTNKRLILKTGLIWRNVTELPHRQVEDISIYQSLWGRVFNYGDLTVTGTGGSRRTYRTIADPLGFHHALYEIDV